MTIDEGELGRERRERLEGDSFVEALPEQMSMQDGIAIFTAEREPIASRTIFVNDAFEAISGYTREQLVGHSALLLQGAKPDLSLLRRAIESPKEPPFFALARKTRPDGTSYDAAIRISTLRDRRGRVTHFMLTERELVEPRWIRPPRSSSVVLRAVVGARPAKAV